MSKLKLVSVIMATYNRAGFIAEALRSIQMQTYENFECLIIDDGGTDNTLEVITPILNKDLRFKFLKRPDNYKKGLPGCRNYGIDLAQGDYIIFFDDDDIVHPENLKINLEVIQDLNVDFCHYQKMSFEKQKPIINNTPITIVSPLTIEDIKKVVTQEIGLASCTVLWKKKCFDTIRFNETLLYAEEWECYTRIISENFKGIIISNVLYYNRKHLNSNTGEFYRNNYIRRESYAEAILLVAQNLKEKELFSASLKRYFTILSKNFREYNLFSAILNALDLSIFEKLKLRFIYCTLPLRLIIYKMKKKIKKINK
jgi:GalNAc5-diNAcBac-PP-undecaprenol beta-1,3-glucosyltransferase